MNVRVADAGEWALEPKSPLKFMVVPFGACYPSSFGVKVMQWAWLRAFVVGAHLDLENENAGMA